MCQDNPTHVCLPDGVILDDFYDDFYDEGETLTGTHCPRCGGDNIEITPGMEGEELEICLDCERIIGCEFLGLES